MSAPATFLFIRHAATDLAGTFCGSSDPALNALGHTQAENLVHALSSEAIQAVYTSDLLRARMTAEPVARAHQAQLHLRPALREIHFGDWEARTWEQIEAQDPVFTARWVEGFPALPTPNGEQVPLFRARILAEFNLLRHAAEPGKRVAIVTHAGPLRVLLEEFGHFAPQHAWECTREYTCTLRCTQTSSGTFTVCN